MDNWQHIQLTLSQNGFGVKIPCSVKFKGMKHHKEGYFIKTFDVNMGGENIMFHYTDSKNIRAIRHISGNFNKPEDIII